MNLNIFKVLVLLLFFVASCSSESFEKKWTHETTKDDFEGKIKTAQQYVFSNENKLIGNISINVWSSGEMFLIFQFDTHICPDEFGGINVRFIQKNLGDEIKEYGFAVNNKRNSFSATSGYMVAALINSDIKFRATDSCGDTLNFTVYKSGLKEAFMRLGLDDIKWQEDYNSTSDKLHDLR